ncbi:hypothetical protein Pst134EA_017364 [Puccinia striiformis f. sp. tritici]|uniref:hypothetical protein n=1 Tax=Puccinia striiformis f. sp. tritici TaxID=168172 RepID=UPI002008DC81|nr:hypothetical protein Pst134EA_017364 [Puccinia striiformis f. sp. tritici]KAH9450760.1 hypothetical protein Pst134EB_018277 [Puccinia striiformis f. sp. tritici]KAH9461055.1 hypothetical protein Pst134EA_017364 [Puccinia striiformis f. sp. tritici]
MDPDSQPVEDLCATSPSGIRDYPRQDHSAAHVQEEEAAAALGEPSGPQHVQEAKAATPLGELSGSQGIQEDEAAAAPGEPSGSQGVQEDEAAAALQEKPGEPMPRKHRMTPWSPTLLKLSRPTTHSRSNRLFRL